MQMERWALTSSSAIEHALPNELIEREQFSAGRGTKPNERSETPVTAHKIRGKRDRERHQ
jgi:hypothetical protein